jgi:hypothetical protein
MIVCIFEHFQWRWALNDRLTHGYFGRVRCFVTLVESQAQGLVRDDIREWNPALRVGAELQDEIPARQSISTPRTIVCTHTTHVSIGTATPRCNTHKRRGWWCPTDLDRRSRVMPDRVLVLLHQLSHGLRQLCGVPESPLVVAALNRT